jgi:hypothetical protein
MIFQRFIISSFIHLRAPARRGRGAKEKGWEEINTIVLELVCPCIVCHSSGSVEFADFRRASRAGAAGNQSFEQSVYNLKYIQFHTLLEQSCTVVSWYVLVYSSLEKHILRLVYTGIYCYIWKNSYTSIY